MVISTKTIDDSIDDSIDDIHTSQDQSGPIKTNQDYIGLRYLSHTCRS